MKIINTCKIKFHPSGTYKSEKNSVLSAESFPVCVNVSNSEILLLGDIH